MEMEIEIEILTFLVYSLCTTTCSTVHLPSTTILPLVPLFYYVLVQRMHLLINSLVTMLRLEEEEAPDALAAAYEPFVGFAPADSEA